LKQVLTPDSAEVLGKWSDGSAAVTVRTHGKGKAFTVGTLAGTSWMKTALRVVPFARGGKGMLYNPVDFDATATKLVRLGVEARKPERAVECSQATVEGVIMDGPKGSLLTLINWSNAPQKDVMVSVRVAAKPSEVRSVQRQKTLESKWADGVLMFKLDVDEADHVLLPK